jgi:hypothetical protein
MSKVDQISNAIRNNEVEKLMNILGDNINTTKIYSDTPLTLALREKKDKIVMTLLEKGADVNIKSDYGNTVLNIAIQYCDKNIILEILGRGAGINSQDNEGNTPLMIASRHRNVEIVELIMDREADVNKRNKINQTALVFAVENNNEMIINKLIDRGADVNNRFVDESNNEMATYFYVRTSDKPLIKAVIIEELNIINLLLERGADVNIQDSEGDTALIVASKSGNEIIVDRLIDAGADVNITNNEGNTALIAAMGPELPEVIPDEELSDEEIEMQLPTLTRTNADVPIDYCNEKIVIKLLLEGADVNINNLDGNNALILAIGHSNETIVKILLDVGAYHKNAIDIAKRHVTNYFGFELLKKKIRIVNILKEHEIKMKRKIFEKSYEISSGIKRNTLKNPDNSPFIDISYVIDDDENIMEIIKNMVFVNGGAEESKSSRQESKSSREVEDAIARISSIFPDDDWGLDGKRKSKRNSKRKSKRKSKRNSKNQKENKKSKKIKKYKIK